MSNGLDPNQEQGFACPDLGPNCLQNVINRSLLARTVLNIELCEN